MTKIAKGHGASLQTYGDLIAEGYRMRYSCSRCRDSGILDLTKFPPGDRYIRSEHFCTCGHRLHCQISPIDLPMMSLR